MTHTQVVAGGVLWAIWLMLGLGLAAMVIDVGVAIVRWVKWRRGSRVSDREFREHIQRQYRDREDQ